MICTNQGQLDGGQCPGVVAAGSPDSSLSSHTPLFPREAPPPSHLSLAALFLLLLPFLHGRLHPSRGEHGGGGAGRSDPSGVAEDGRAFWGTSQRQIRTISQFHRDTV